MISVDTNILIRIVTNDDPRQAKRAANVLAKDRVFIAKTVFLEMEWILRRAYLLEKKVILKAFRNILGLMNVEAEDELRVVQALEWYETGLDFADALHLASSGNASQLVTFDKEFAKKSKKINRTRVSVV
ncbi:MAG: type II toxin-antitoxin system VapC family toxin [Nitrospirae bacterium]|nr:type II toxin-antitoxin system VapC family toxin [Nitrospirota bacterium]MBI3352645.1 type II toxin-antitoxin system VapC family toxin [Nitrospirota bacterium]